MSGPADHATGARRLLRHFHSGVLGTRGVRYTDYPYTAAMPYCTDHQGRIVVFVSHLSEHTKAIQRDARVSFTVSPMMPQLRPEARVTVLGRVAPNDDPQIAARYLRLLPDNRQFLDIGGFRFYTIEPAHVRFIAGFGSAHWLKGASVLATPSPITAAEEHIIDHMNSDHRSTLVDYCRHAHGVEAATVELVGVDCDGIDVRAIDKLYRIEFESEVRTAGDARSALVALAEAARS